MGILWKCVPEFTERNPALIQGDFRYAWLDVRKFKYMLQESPAESTTGFKH